jgi:hypothetical protein
MKGIVQLLLLFKKYENVVKLKVQFVNCTLLSINYKLLSFNVNFIFPASDQLEQTLR